MSVARRVPTARCARARASRRRARVPTARVARAQTWALFDPTGSGTISREELVALLEALPPPLGCKRSVVHHHLSSHELEEKLEERLEHFEERLGEQLGQ